MAESKSDKPKTTWQDVKAAWGEFKAAVNDAAGQAPVRKAVIETTFKASEFGVPFEVVRRIGHTVNQFEIGKDAQVRITVEVLGYTEPVISDDAL